MMMDSLETSRRIKVFNNIEEMQPYYDKKTNTYEFFEEGLLIDIKLNFDLYIKSNLIAYNITAKDITAYNITAKDITAYNINVRCISGHNITVKDINIKDMYIIQKKLICNTINGKKSLEELKNGFSI